MGGHATHQNPAVMRSPQLNLAEATRAKPRAMLPDVLPPRGLCRARAAAYVGIGTTLFDTWAAGRNLTYRIGKRVLYDRWRLDAAIDELLDGEEAEGNDAYAPERQAA
jgi:hypothetical protein